MTDDERLYQQYLAGDETAADELVARYGDTLAPIQADRAAGLNLPPCLLE